MDDHDRPLNTRGKHDAPEVGRMLREQSLVPDLIVTSSAKRARKTARIVAENCGYEAEVCETRTLYLASPQTYIEQLRNLADEPGRVMVVGHNPGLEGLVRVLTGQSETMPTAALAVVSLEVDRWSQLTGGQQGKLVHLWRPKDE